ADACSRRRASVTRCWRGRATAPSPRPPSTTPTNSARRSSASCAIRRRRCTTTATSSGSCDMNRRLVLASRPVGVPQPHHFRLEEVASAEPGPGLLLVENIWLSVDPAQRGYVNDENNYAPPVPLGGVMRALAVGRVVRSNCEEYAAGEYLYGWFGWQEFCVCAPSAVLRRVRPEQAPISAGAGLLGINGLTAWMALHDIGQPKPGETVV